MSLFRSHKIEIVRDKDNLGFPESEKYIKKAVKSALKAEGVNVPCIVQVMLTDDAGIHDINLRQRNIDRPTDVLSFPMNELQPEHFSAEDCEYDYTERRYLLGDMVLSLERCAAQGEEFGHGYERELSYLAVHSVLHLLGYDHMDDGPQKAQMRAHENTIMSALKL